jgi:two-component system, OmpR family, response regulator
LSKILLIEDDKEIGELLSEHLGGYGMTVVCAEKPSVAFEALKSGDIDLVVLDLMLPEMNGFEVCKKIKSEYDLPIIISSARGNTSDKVLGLDLGADDYLTKGYEPIELVKRIEAVLRRYRKSEKDSDIEFTVDERAMTIKFKGEPLALTNSEYELMRLFLNSKGKALNRDDIANAIEFLNWDSTSRNVDVLVSKLRNKLGDDPKNPKYIKSVWGHGYKFIGQ